MLDVQLLNSITGYVLMSHFLKKGVIENIDVQKYIFKKAIYTSKLTQGAFSCKMKNNCEGLHLLSYILYTKYFKRLSNHSIIVFLSDNFSATQDCCENK